MMIAILFILLLAAGTGWAQAGPDGCCKCGGGASSEQTADVICLSAKEMRAQVDHVEPLQPSGLGTGLKLTGTVLVEVRFGPDGKVACARAKSGHPIAISAAMEALPKWTFKPLISKGVPKSGCGRITIKYRLRDHGSRTELGEVRGSAIRYRAASGGAISRYGYDALADLDM
jgi:TonB family protein